MLNKFYNVMNSFSTTKQSRRQFLECNLKFLAFYSLLSQLQLTPAIAKDIACKPYGSGPYGKGKYCGTSLKLNYIPPAESGSFNSVFNFVVSGPFGSSVISEYSNDLVNWTPMQINQVLTPTSEFEVADQNISDVGHRFYRAHLINPIP
jgi:hypothetical protein